MSFVFAAITPHSPLLLPSIGKENTKQLEHTRTALKKLEEELYLSKPQYIVLITPHGSLFSDAYVVNGHTNFENSFAELGDVETKKRWAGAPDLAAAISHKAKKSKMPVRVVSQEIVDHGTSIPLFFLTEHLPHIKVLPVGFSGFDNSHHVEFGDMLKDVISNHEKRIAVLASADLAHLTEYDTSIQRSAILHIFDEKITQLLKDRDVHGIIHLDQKIVESANACGYRSLLILLGMLQHTPFTFTPLAYDAPFGVGYLTGYFDF